MKELFIPVFNQMVYLFIFIAVGYLLMKCKFVPDNSEKVLSKIENMIFLPAAVMVTFISDCTAEKIAKSWSLLVFSFALGILFILISIFFSRLLFREERYLRNITTYGLCFSNFAYMGLAVIPAVIPAYELEYTIFILPLWFLIYTWGAPVLLIGGSSGNEKVSMKQRMKNFINPMMIGMSVGLIIGLTGIGKYIPAVVSNALSAGKNCMSPIAMILTGMTIAKINLLSFIKKWKLYIIAAIKLLLYPMLFILFVVFLPQNAFFNEVTLTCAFCVTCMPAGLNTIVIPAGYGKDTSDAAGMALITHLLSVLTIPLMFMLFKQIVL